VQHRTIVSKGAALGAGAIQAKQASALNSNSIISPQDAEADIFELIEREQQQLRN
jgi:hypothetical protein